MSTLGTLKNDVRSDLGNSAFSGDYIGQAAANAIRFYQPRRFYFNESREKTFLTVADQTWYSESDDADIGLIKQVDAMVIETASYDRRLGILDVSALEVYTDAGSSTAEPDYWAYYNRQIGLYPTPDDAYTIRILGLIGVAGPASDGESDNPWMVEAYDLIRARVLVDIFMYRQRDLEMAQAARLREKDELSRIERETERRLGTGHIVPMTI